LLDHEVFVTLLLTTERDDVEAALRRSGLIEGDLLGETIIETVTTVALEDEGNA
jgi:hypothetical protein